MIKKKRALVTGAASGLGNVITERLERDHGFDVIRFDLTTGKDVRQGMSCEYVQALKTLGGLDVLVNCAGVNKINWLAEVSGEEWDEVLDTNVKGMFLMTQSALPLLMESRGTVLNIVSNAAHMPMRCSAAYNASKGAALMLTKQLARELSGNGITVFSISPNKLAGTAMSDSIDQQVVKTRGWTLEEAKDYQLSGLLSGAETPVNVLAEFIGFLLSKKERHEYLTGCDIPYGA